MAKINILGSDYDDIYTLLGVLTGNTDMGTFVGVTIQDNVAVKQALQDLETALEAIPNRALTNDGDNRVLTALGNGNLNAEANLTFDGSVLEVTGKIGIDTTPSTDFEINGVIYAGILSNERTPTTGTGFLDVGIFSVDGAVPSLYWNAYYTGTVENYTTTGEAFRIKGGTTLEIGYAASGTGGTGVTIDAGITLTSTGDVGVNTVSPDSKFHIVTDADEDGILLERDNATGDVSIKFKVAANDLDQYQKGAIYFDQTASDGRGSIILATSDATGTGNVAVSDARMTIDRQGKIAFNAYTSGTITGTANKFLAVDTSGNVIEEDAPSGFSVTNETDNRIITSSGTGTGNAEQYFTYTDTAGATPVLTVGGYTGTTYTASITVQGRRTGSGGAIAALNFNNNDVTTYTAAKIESYNEGATDDGDLRFYTSDNASNTEKLRIDELGVISNWVTLTAGETVAAGDVCYYKSDGKMWKTDADAQSTSQGLLGIAIEAITANNSGRFLSQGIYTTTGLTAGSEYWLSTTAAGWTTTQPSGTGDIVRSIGYALSTTQLYFKPSNTFIEI